jgi:hypothetical protein
VKLTAPPSAVLPTRTQPPWEFEEKSSSTSVSAIRQRLAAANKAKGTDDLGMC